MKIFLSYRRADGEAIVGRIGDALVGRYGERCTFIDFEKIPFGADFREHIIKEFDQCDVLLAIIGSRWLGLNGAASSIMRDGDYVRSEIEVALSRGITILPVLIGVAAMPLPEQLPISIQKLSFLNAVSVDSGRNFRVDMESVIETLDTMVLGKGAPHRLDNKTKFIQSLAFSPDGTVLASASSDAPLKFWDVSSRQVLREFGGSAHLIAFAPNGKRFASAGSSIGLWEPLSGALLRKLEGPIGFVSSIAFSPDSSTLAASLFDGRILLWDALSGELVRTLREFKVWKKQACCVAFSPDGNLLASTHYRFWDWIPRRLTFLAVLLPPASPETCLWSVQSGEVIHRLKGTLDPLAFSPDGETLVASGETLVASSFSGSLNFWKLDSEGPRFRFQISCDRADSLVYSPNGRLIASGALYRTVHLWDSESGSHIRELKDGEYKSPSHTDGIDTDLGAVRALAFSPDGSLLASGSNDGIIRLWNTDPRFDRARARIKAQSEAP